MKMVNNGFLEIWGCYKMGNVLKIVLGSIKNNVIKRFRNDLVLGFFFKYRYIK